jgi:hypothetical protein
MESGKHRMSLKITKGEGNGHLVHFFGLVRDGAARDKPHFECGSREGTNVWYMGDYGALFGNGKEGDESAGSINEGQIVSMEADLDKCMLRF